MVLGNIGKWEVIIMGNEGTAALATVFGCIMRLIQEDQERLILLYILDT